MRSAVTRHRKSVYRSEQVEASFNFMAGKGNYQACMYDLTSLEDGGEASCAVSCAVSLLGRIPPPHM